MVHTFLIWGTIGLGENVYWEGGTPHIHSKEKSIWSGGWVDDSFRKYCHFVAPSCKLELARFSALLRIKDGNSLTILWLG